MPRKGAAERYSPEMAAALSPGGTCRAATMKSSGVRATRMPRAPTTIVSRVTNAIAPTAASVIGLSHRAQSSGSVIARPAGRVDQVGKSSLELAGLPVVEPADREEHGVEREAEHDQGERETGHPHPADRRHQRGDERERDCDGQRDHEAEQGQAELRPHQRADEQPAGVGVVSQVPGPGDIVLNWYLVAAPDDELALCWLGRGRPDLRHGQLRRPTRRIRSRTSRTWRRLTGSDRPPTITVCTLPVTENSVMCLNDTRKPR